MQRPRICICLHLELVIVEQVRAPKHRWMFVDSALIGAALIAARDPNPTRGATETEQMLCSKELSLKLSLQLNSSLGKSLKVPVVFKKKKKWKQFLGIVLTFLSSFLLQGNLISFRGNITVLFERSSRVFLHCQNFLWSRKTFLMLPNKQKNLNRYIPTSSKKEGS